MEAPQNLELQQSRLSTDLPLGRGFKVTRSACRFSSIFKTLRQCGCGEQTIVDAARGLVGCGCSCPAKRHQLWSMRRRYLERFQGTTSATTYTCTLSNATSRDCCFHSLVPHKPSSLQTLLALLCANPTQTSPQLFAQTPVDVKHRITGALETLRAHTH